MGSPEAWRERLYLPAYSIRDAARYALTSSPTVSRWFRTGGLPALLGARKPRLGLSYMQLVEVAFVATFRKHGVPMARIRTARSVLADQLGSKFPFAECRLLTEGSHVLMREFGPGVLTVLDARGQLAWERLLAERYYEFRFVDDLAVTWYPRGEQAGISIDPRFAFGAPTIGGVPTWVLAQRILGGESESVVAADYCLTEKQVRAAKEFELRTAA